MTLKTIYTPRGQDISQPRRPLLPTLRHSQALEYSAFSARAMKRAEEDILRRLEELLENLEENALEIAYTAKLLRLVQQSDVKGIREFAK